MNFIVREISRRGEEHRNNCEDSSLFIQKGKFIFSFVLDGCSSGVESHFASTLFKKIFINVLEGVDHVSLEESEMNNVNSILEKFFIRLKDIVKLLELPSDSVLSTIVMSCTNIETKTSFAIILGDGLISVDGKTVANIEPENNAPDYIAYHLNKSFYEIWDKHTFMFDIDNIDKTISICTDGITSFKSKDKLEDNFEYHFLLVDERFIKKENMLSRKCNILNRTNFSFHGDDLSIIRIDFKEETKNEDL